jgi:gas vesicle protein
MEKSNNTGKLVGALLLGAAIGGALGILFAPAKGLETRRKLSAKGEDLTDAVKDKFNDFLDEIKTEVEAATDKAKEFVNHGN